MIFKRLQACVIASILMFSSVGCSMRSNNPTTSALTEEEILAMADENPYLKEILDRRTGIYSIEDRVPSNGEFDEIIEEGNQLLDDFFLENSKLVDILGIEDSDFDRVKNVEYYVRVKDESVSYGEKFLLDMMLPSRIAYYMPSDNSITFEVSNISVADFNGDTLATVKYVTHELMHALLLDNDDPESATICNDYEIIHEGVDMVLLEQIFDSQTDYSYPLTTRFVREVYKISGYDDFMALQNGEIAEKMFDKNADKQYLELVNIISAKEVCREKLKRKDLRKINNALRHYAKFYGKDYSPIRMKEFQ